MRRLDIRTILVGVDGSTAADAATDVAAALARKCSGSLILLHVVAPLPEGRLRNELNEFVRMEHHELTEYEMLQNAGRDIVSKSETRVRESGLNQIESLVEVGDAAERIVNMAGARNVDVIVLGRRGRGTIAQLLLGSVSHKVIQIAKCSVMIVPFT